MPKSDYNTPDTIATLIVWEDGIDPERIKRWLDKLRDAGHIKTAQTQDFNSEYTYPVLYLV